MNFVMKAGINFVVNLPKILKSIVLALGAAFFGEIITRNETYWGVVKVDGDGPLIIGIVFLFFTWAGTYYEFAERTGKVHRLVTFFISMLSVNTITIILFTYLSTYWDIAPRLLIIIMLLLQNASYQEKLVQKVNSRNNI